MQQFWKKIVEIVLFSASALILNTLEHFAQQFVSPSLKTFNQQHFQKLPTKFFLQTDHRPRLDMGLILQKCASYLHRSGKCLKKATAPNYHLNWFISFTKLTCTFKGIASTLFGVERPTRLPQIFAVFSICSVRQFQCHWRSFFRQITSAMAFLLSTATTFATRTPLWPFWPPWKGKKRFSIK